VTEVTPQSSAAVSTTDVVADLKRFESTILTEMQRVGLPTDGVVANWTSAPRCSATSAV
jgi:hypothetical protein